MLHWFMSEFLLFIEENGFVENNRIYTRVYNGSKVRVTMRTECMIDMYYFTNTNPTYYIYYSVLMSMNGKLHSNGMKMSTFQKIFNNMDIIFGEVKKSDSPNIRFRNSSKFFGKFPISLDIYPSKIFHINDSNEKLMTVDLEDGLTFEHHDAIPMNDSFL